MKASFATYITLLCLVFLPVAAMSKTTTVPFIQLPTGQVLVEADLMNDKGKQYFIIETAGTNLIRRDMTERLKFLGIDTAAAFVEFPEIKIGDMLFIKKNKFRTKKALGKRSEYAFPPSALGTLGPKFFAKKVLQFDFQNKTLKIADDITELTIKNTVPYAYFTQSFTHAVPTIDFHSAESKDFDLYIDVSLAIGINFPTTSMSPITTFAGPDEKRNYKLSLDGEKYITYTAITAPTAYINRRITLTDVEISFTDELMPAIGNAFLKHFLTTLDLNNGVIYLDPITEEGRSIMKNTKVEPVKQKK